MKNFVRTARYWTLQCLHKLIKRSYYYQSIRCFFGWHGRLSPPSGTSTHPYVYCGRCLSIRKFFQ